MFLYCVLLDHTMLGNWLKQIIRNAKFDIEGFRKCPSAQLLNETTNI